MMLRLVALFTVLVAGTCKSIDITSDSSDITFELPGEEESSGSVSVKAGDYSCSVVFEVGPESSDTEGEVEEAPEGTVDDVMNRVRENTECAVSRPGAAWEYSVCPGRAVEQRAVSGRKEVFSLGTYRLHEGRTEKYMDGTKCAAVRPVRGRISNVEYVCGEKLAIVRATESSICTYDFVVTTPLGCGIKDFEQKPKTTKATDVDRPWRLSIEELGDGTVSCSVSVVDDLKNGGFTADVDDAPNLEWSSFTLAVQRTDETHRAEHSHDTSLKPVHHVARSINRVPYPTSAVQVHRPDGSSVPVTMSCHYPRPAEFLQLVVLDEEAELHS